MTSIYDAKKEYFQSGITKDYNFRIEQLKKLKTSIEFHENAIMEALKEDLRKPDFEGYTSEIGIVYGEINHTIKNLRKWMKSKRVSTPIYLQPGKSYIVPEPKGVVLIIGPWNYPFQLIFSPLIGAISAGNCVVLKPSSQSKKTESIISKIIDETFDSEYISVVNGPGPIVNSLIENYRFDHIFFTGSTQVGKNILELSAKHLTTTTLELGGKSPTIVHKDMDMDLAAKRITWAKFFNLGQTCIAPDYVLVHESKKDALVKGIIKYLDEFYGMKKEESKDLGRIINHKRFDNLISLLDKGNIIVGGNYNKDTRFIEPTLIDNVDISDPIMQEEIFGPILPILSYNHISKIINIVNLNPYPLAIYLFTKDKELENYIINNIQFGGGCINHSLSHIINPYLPFGGVGYSGMGQYHSKYTFDTFSHKKSIFKALGRFEPNLKYPPYSENKLNLAKKFMK